jgi:predicted RNA-binding Zn-ribbon protein involved in translation (DUF1610 family)
MPNQQEHEDWDEDIHEAGSCPKCGHSPVQSRPCDQIQCEDGYIDESDEDYCLPGIVLVKCSECRGTGFIMWCPACGVDLTGQKVL